MPRASRSPFSRRDGGPRSPASLPVLAAEDREVLRDLAREGIRHGVEEGRALEVDPSRYRSVLQAPAATFVTLRLEGSLRGCVGSLRARRPLVVDVATTAFAAAFRDSRFPPVSAVELPDLDIHISLLSTPEPLALEREEDLLDILEPGVDGLVLEDPPCRATFLPQVWEVLPAPADFVRELKLKAGLSPRHWSSTLRVSRYTVEEI